LLEGLQTAKKKTVSEKNDVFISQTLIIAITLKGFIREEQVGKFLNENLQQWGVL